MSANMPSEWFKSGKAHQFEGRHLEAVTFFEKCLAADWRIELTSKEIYNSLVKLRDYKRAAEILFHFGPRIHQKDWLFKEQLNMNKKLAKTEIVQSTYTHMLKELVKNFDIHRAKLLSNELALYFYRLGLLREFDALCDQFALDDILKVYLPMLRCKWLIHFVKDIKQAQRVHLQSERINGNAHEDHFNHESLTTAIANYKDHMHLNQLYEGNTMDHVYPLADSLFYRIDFMDHIEISISKLIHDNVLADSLILFDRLLRLECLGWSLVYIIALGKVLIRENVVRIALQALATELVKSQNMHLLETLTAGIPNLYSLSDNQDQTSDVLSEVENADLELEVNQALTIDIPLWSKSTADYLDSFIDHLATGIDVGLMFVKKSVISDVKRFSMTQDETLDALWRMRAHYQGESLEKGLVWLRQLLDMLVQDIQNEGLWLELPYVILYLLKRQGLNESMAKRLTKAGNHAFLYALYTLSKKNSGYPLPNKQYIEDAFDMLPLESYWIKYINYIETCQYYGLEICHWDSLYGYFQAIKNNPILEEEYLEHIKNHLYYLSLDLNMLTKKADSMRYLQATQDNLIAAFPMTEHTLEGSMPWLLQGYLALGKGDFVDFAIAMHNQIRHAYKIEELNDLLVLMSVIQYEDQSTGLDVLCKNIEALLQKTHDQDIRNVYEFLRDRDTNEVGRLGYKLINHALINMKKGQAVDPQFVTDVRVDYLERVALEEGLALFELISALDPTSLSLSFQAIDLKICLQQYREAAIAIEHWIKQFSLTECRDDEANSLYNTILYQMYWIQATGYYSEPLKAVDEISQAILNVKLETSQQNLEFLRDVLIHRDIEIVFVLIKQKGHESSIQSKNVLQLLNLIFGKELRGLVLLLWQNQERISFVNVYSDMLKAVDDKVGMHFEAHKKLYRHDYGSLDQLVSFKRGKVKFNLDAWIKSLEGSIQYSQADRYLWLMHVGSFVIDPEVIADNVAEKLDFYRYTKWSHDSWWIKAYDVIPYGKVAVEMGKEALRQGRYETAKQCYQWIPVTKIALAMANVTKPLAQNGLLAVKDYDSISYLDSALAHLLGPNGLQEFDEVVKANLSSEKALMLYESIFARMEAKEFGKSLKEALRNILFRSEFEHLILAWYIHEQRLSEHHQLASKLQSLYIQGL